MKAYLSELREGIHVLTGRAFWRDFRAYWSPDAVAARMDAWVERQGKP